MTGAEICYLTNDGGYATVVLVTKYTLASNTFVAYVPTETTARQSGTTWYNGVYSDYYAYDVYKLGETTTTTIYSKDADLFKFNQTNTLGDRDGFYDITVNAEGVVTYSQRFIATYAYDTVTNVTTAHGEYLWDRAWVTTDLIGGSLQTADKNGTTANKDFSVDATKYLKVEKDTLPTGTTSTVISEASAADMVQGTKVIVAYTDKANNPAAYVYVIDTEGSAVTPTQSKYKVNSTSGYNVKVNNAILAAAPNYTNTAAGDANAALAGAVANATELSLKTLPYTTVGPPTIPLRRLTPKTAPSTSITMPPRFPAPL